jgi:hypothetical protein
MRQITFSIAAFAALLVLSSAQPSMAQTSGGDSVSMKTLLQQGYEIRAAAPNGSQYVVFLQKGKSAYACEFVTLTTSRCGSINKEAE